MDCNGDTFFNRHPSTHSSQQEYRVSMGCNEDAFLNRYPSYHSFQQTFPQVPFLATVFTLDRQYCPKCWKKFGRRQDRDRHLLLHLPCSLYCPYPSCSWRGDRTNLFRQHWNAHACGPVPKREGYQIYPSKMILDWITNGRVSTDVAADYALLFAEGKARDLGKLEAWKNLWGRKRKVDEERKEVLEAVFPIATGYFDGVGPFHHKSRA
ncbi:hypothetical protein BJY52DRAFT_946735 [Lactarius psammicola]|nr:hypothetical protein BJY52DRAFT_946735 [Lactarius psammicola]